MRRARRTRRLGLLRGLRAMVVRRVGKYEVGRTIGEGNFAKVKFAQNTETGESVAMKVLDRATIIKHKMVDQVLLFFLPLAVFYFLVICIFVRLVLGLLKGCI